MSLLTKAKKELMDESAQRREREKRDAEELERRDTEKKKKRAAWYKRIKELAEESDIKIQEIAQGFAFASLVKKGVVIGYFHLYDESGSGYGCDYGCDVPWSNSSIVFSPCEQYIPRNSQEFFHVARKDSEPEKTLKLIESSLINFYKRAGWV